MTVGGMAATQIAASPILLLAAWLGLRRTVGAALRGTPPRLLALDALPIAALWVVLVAVSGRPLLASAIVCVAAVGLACGDRAKRTATGEPLVFTDSVLFGIFRYPSLYAEFVTPPILIVAVAATLGLVGAWAVIEPALWSAQWPGTAVGLGVAAALVLLHRRRRRWLSAVIGDATLGDARRDAASLGPLAAVTVHSLVAGEQRAGLRLLRVPGLSDALPQVDCPRGPIVLLQLESFFDARRMGSFVPADLLPQFDRCVAGSVRHGRLQTPAYGANTVRTEFAVLTGLSDEAVGLDRFNPYAAFARVPIDSLAWRLKAAGYRTVCLHPFASRFYGRHRAIPNLGFDTFLDIASFEVAQGSGRYVPDTALVEQIERILAQYGRNTFVFAISMGNHSPWQAAAAPSAAMPQCDAFAGFLDGLRCTDAAIGQMAEIMRREWRDGLLAVFGDHQPSFAALRRHVGFADRQTDYFFYRPDHAFSQRRDIAAHDMPGLLLHDAAAFATARARLTLATGD